MADEALFLGFDLSTQQLKGIVVKADLKVVYEAKVDFDADLGKYGIKKGVLQNPAEGEIYAPTAMWLEAMELVLRRLKEQGLDFGKIRALSGAGMQHGTVFWSKNAGSIMGSLNPEISLFDQLAPTEDNGAGAFSHPHSPNWQDASTQKQCELFDRVLGSAEKLALVTGSKAHHRFSGPQILRFREKYPEHYANTSRISLVSSFIATIFLGHVAPIDIGDVCGMNLWDINDGKWHEELVSLAAGGQQGVADLIEKLGTVYEDGGKHLGTISGFWTTRYGFHKDCEIIACTGDNPSTILALPLQASDAIVSLGTSTTFLMSTPEYKPDPSYHFMNHPTTAGLYMFMLCYKNGGLARENIRDAINELDSTTRGSKSWNIFDEVALSTPTLGQKSPDKDQARLGLFFPRPEIVPNVKAGTWRYLWDSASKKLSPITSGTEAWPRAVEDARAIVESQFLSLRLRSQKLVRAQRDASGKPIPAQPRRVYLVGGGSNNDAIAKLAGEVLGGAEGVFKLDIGGNACALGSAYKACWGINRKGNETFEDFVAARWTEEDFVKRIAEGYTEGIYERYGEALEGFEAMEQQVLLEAAEGS